MAWEEPLEWITTTRDDKFVVNETAAKLIAKIDQPLTVVAVAGLYRTGKSYIMNRLAGKSSGFALGSTVQSKTKGIWIWCLPHPRKRNETLVLIDTEGLGDPEKGSEQHDMTIFCLAVLLCSTFIFNAIGKIDQDMIDKLYFVTELTERIKVKSSSAASDEESLLNFTEYFPNFILAVRDFTLELVLDGREVTPDEYFNHILLPKKGMSKSTNEYNLPRDAIRNAFKSRNCFVFSRPVNDENLFPKLARNELTEKDLSPKFIDQSNKFCNFVLNTSVVKNLQQGVPISGPTFVTMCEEYVKAINLGAVPCIESTVSLVSERENKRIALNSLELYKEAMETLGLPVPAEVLDKVHQSAYDNSLNYFREHCVFDNGQVFDEVSQQLREMYANKLTENEMASTKKCTALINGLFATIIGQKLDQKQYSCIGGYKDYCNDMDKLQYEYERVPDKGVKADEVFNTFMRDRTERKIIMDADMQLTEMDKQIEAAANEAKIAAREAEAQRLELAKEQQRSEQLREEHKIQVAKMEEKYKREQEEKDKENQRLIEQRLEEHKLMLEKGFQDRAAEMKAEIQKLREQNKPSAFESILGTISSVADAVGSVVSLRNVWRGAGNLPRAAGRFFR